MGEGKEGLQKVGLVKTVLNGPRFKTHVGLRRNGLHRQVEEQGCIGQRFRGFRLQHIICQTLSHQTPGATQVLQPVHPPIMLSAKRQKQTH